MKTAIVILVLGLVVLMQAKPKTWLIDTEDEVVDGNDYSDIGVHQPRDQEDNCNNEKFASVAEEFKKCREVGRLECSADGTKFSCIPNAKSWNPNKETEDKVVDGNDYSDIGVHQPRDQEDNCNKFASIADEFKKCREIGRLIECSADGTNYSCILNPKSWNPNKETEDKVVYGNDYSDRFIENLPREERFIDVHMPKGHKRSCEGDMWSAESKKCKDAGGHLMCLNYGEKYVCWLPKIYEVFPKRELWEYEYPEYEYKNMRPVMA